MAKQQFDMAAMVYQGVGGLHCALMDGDGYKKFAGGLRLYVALVKDVKVGIYYQPGIAPTHAKDRVCAELGALIEARRVTLGI